MNFAGFANQITRNFILRNGIASAVQVMHFYPNRTSLKFKILIFFVGKMFALEDEEISESSKNNLCEKMFSLFYYTLTFLL